jgi:hypothetical protein
VQNILTLYIHLSSSNPFVILPSDQ